MIVHSSSVEVFGKLKCKVLSESKENTSVSPVKVFTPSAKILRTNFFAWGLTENTSNVSC